MTLRYEAIRSYLSARSNSRPLGGAYDSDTKVPCRAPGADIAIDDATWLVVLRKRPT